MAFLVMAILMMNGMGCLGLSFNFPTFESNETYPDISIMNDTYLADHFISLVADNSTYLATQWSVGRVLYNYPVPLWTKDSAAASTIHLASFSTSFRFRIQNTTDNSETYSGDGMAFLLAGNFSFAPSTSNNDGLGILDRTLIGRPSNNIVAVEFDIYKDSKFYDIDDNHVGIDVNSLISSSNASLSKLGINLKSGNDLMAWLDYDGDSKLLSVFVSTYEYNFTTKPSAALISYSIDLSQVLPQDIYVGFSAGNLYYTAIYEIYSWQFNSTPLPIPYIPAPAPARVATIVLHNKLPGWVIPTIVPVSLFLIVLLFVSFCLIRRQMNKNNPSRRREWRLDESELAECGGARRFSYKEIMSATRKLSQENYLGRGGFGPVFKGILPKVGTPVAVKSIGQNSIQGEKEFLAEVKIISGIRHRNLLQLQGWCHEKGHLFLVYDYMPNGSLDQHLFKGGNGRSNIENPPLDWHRRYAIVCGLAAALQYLHQEWEKQVIHRDVKSANVLLDHDFTPRLGDFGMARLVDHDQMPHTTVGAGTLGYLAPEVAESGRATSASDVYSFGAVALEAACGRRVLDHNAPHPNQVRLVEWVWELYSEGHLLEAADPRLDGNFEKEEMERVLRLGLACLHSIPLSRPTMRQVLVCLLKTSPTPPISTTKPVVYSNPFFEKNPYPTPPTNISQDVTATPLSSSASSSLMTTRLLPR